MVNQGSIHPRNWVHDGVKKNTCAPRSRARLLRAQAGIQRHIDTHSNDAEARQRLANLTARLAGIR